MVPAVDLKSRCELGPDGRLALPESHFDNASLSSVSNHLDPEVARHVLGMLRRHAMPGGQGGW